MNTKQTTSEPLAAAGLFCVGMPDTQGGMCWLAGYDSDPTRYYTPSCALTFETWQAAAEAIERAKQTHPFKERTYRIMTVAEMETQNVSDHSADYDRLNFWCQAWMIKLNHVIMLRNHSYCDKQRGRLDVRIKHLRARHDAALQRRKPFADALLKREPNA